MEWGELLRGVGDWTAGIADSTLAAGVIGAAAAIVASQIGRRRREAREDKALWSDRRHLAYTDLLAVADKISEVARQVEIDVMYRAPIGNFIDSTEKLESLTKIFEVHTKSIRLMTGRRLRQQLWDAGVALDTLVSQLNLHHADSDSDQVIDYLRVLAEATGKSLTTAEVYMRHELGLPEDE